MNENNMEKVPLSVVVSQLKNELADLILKYQQQGLPNYIIEGIISSILVDVVKGSASEIEADYAAIIRSMQESANSPKEEKEG